MCIIRPSHLLFFFLKQSVKKKKESVGRKKAETSCWQNWKRKPGRWLKNVRPVNDGEKEGIER